MDSTPSSTAHDRVRRLFQFVGAYAERHTPVRQSLSQHDWLQRLHELPEDPNVEFGFFESSEADEDEPPPSFVLRLRRPQETPPPPLPEELIDWVVSGWKALEWKPRHLAARNIQHRPLVGESRTTTVDFNADSSRVAAWEKWEQTWIRWRAAERPVRRVIQQFERLFELRGRLKREGDGVQLWLGDGMLGIGEPTTIDHPILLQRVELRFDPKLPEFTIIPTDDPPELHTSLLRKVEGLDGAEMARLQKRLEDGEVNVQNIAAVRSFCIELVNSLFKRGQFCHERPDEIEKASVWREPVVFLAPRTARVAEAVKQCIERLDNETEPPSALSRIVGVEPGLAGNALEHGERTVSGAIEPVDFLLTKESNAEQESILRSLHSKDHVCVQGPPGTGKTHTIANIVGHLLAHGKRVLIASHTAKALRIIRRQIVDDLQPLSVSVLDSDADSRRELEESVHGITGRISRSNVPDLQRSADSAAKERANLKELIQSKQDDLRLAIQGEYQPIVIAGEQFPPSDAARTIAAAPSDANWIPGQISPGAPMPLSRFDLAELYRLAGTITSEDEQSLAGQLPDIDRLPSPEQFEVDVEEIKRLSDSKRTHIDDDWVCGPLETSSDALRTLFKDADRAMRPIKQRDPATLEWIEAGRLGGGQRQIWDDLIATIERLGAEIDQHQATAIKHSVRARLPGSVEEQLEQCRAIRAKYQRSPHIGRLCIAMWPPWKRFVNGTEVEGHPPRSDGDFDAIESFLMVRSLREQLVHRWRSQCEQFKSLSEIDFGDRPETGCSEYIRDMRLALTWHEKQWEPVLERIRGSGFDWDALHGTTKKHHTRFGALYRIREAVEGPLRTVFDRQIKTLKRGDLLEQHRCVEELLAAIRLVDDVSKLASAFAAAVKDRDSASYKEAYLALEVLSRKRADAERRRELLGTLREAAPDWASAVELRLPPHDGETMPGDPEEAWRLRQFTQVLDERSRLNPAALQNEINSLRGRLHEETCRYVDARAWIRQKELLDSSSRGLELKSSLMGWMQTVNKRGFQSGKRSAELKAQAREELSKSRDAVPVWIMTVLRAIDSLDFNDPQFDVLIIDEASQCDIYGLLLMSVAEQIIVVGDDKQVSPSAVGDRSKTIQALIDEYLEDIPSRQLFDGQASIYDMATRAFPATVRLIEHFRCAEDIIQFSNELSYEGQIKPLRDVSNVRTKPFCIAHRVAGGRRRERSRINVNEAEEVAALLIACTEQPEYVGSTFGVISLVGDDQAREIDAIVRHRLHENVFYQCDILCGNASQFQGDERNVMFLSLVDHGEGVPLRIRRDDATRKRFNVAASRAKDQLWVVHSLDPESELQPDDLRRRLIDHGLDPGRTRRMREAADAKADSEFERQVMSRLADCGYRYNAQWPVGSLRIDIVVHGRDDRKIAIECDGDRYHPIEKIPEDMERQALLERLGWRFIRIRGSAWFRDPTAEFDRVVEELERCGIDPIGAIVELDATEDDLRQRVVRRAAELRRAWQAEREVTALDDDDEDYIDAATDVDESPEIEVLTTTFIDGEHHQVRPDSPLQRMLNCIREAGHPLTRAEIVQRIDLPIERFGRMTRTLLANGLLMVLEDDEPHRYMTVTANTDDDDE